MADMTDALMECTQEITKLTNGKLDASGRAAIRQVFELTVGAFAAKGERQVKPIKVWENPKFRTFILGQVKRIGKQAEKNAGSGKVTGKVLNTAAVEVMTKTQKFCRTAITNGRLRVIIEGIDEEGEVCGNYLAQKTQ
jgi:hypothetical protein